MQVLSEAMGRWDLKLPCHALVNNYSTLITLLCTSSDGRVEKEVEARIASATRMVGQMSEVLKR